MLRYQGSVSVFRTGSVHLRDLFPTIPETLESCAEAGVLGATTAVIGSLVATETLKFLAGLPTLEGRLLTYEALSSTFQNFALSPDPERVPVTDLSAYELPKILLDVREQSEREIQVKYPDSLHLPLSAATEDAVRAMSDPITAVVAPAPRPRRRIPASLGLWGTDRADAPTLCGRRSRCLDTAAPTPTPAEYRLSRRRRQSDI